MLIREARASDFQSIVSINASEEEKTSPIDLERITQLNTRSTYHRVAIREDQEVGFLLVMSNASGYDGANFRWFVDRYSSFLYVDRIVIDPVYAGMGVGTALGTNVGLGINGNGQVQTFDAFAASTGGTFGTFGSSDTTPSVATGNLWKTHASEQTLTDFLDGLAGQIIVVISTAAVTFDVTSSGLKGGSTDIVTASGDVTVWAYDGTDWHLVQFMDVSADMSSVGGGGGGMSNFVLEDGDGTEVTIGDGKEVKFVEGGGIDINWTDTDNGTDGDPYDLTFTVEATGVGTALATGGVRGTADQLGEVLFNQVMSG